MKKYFLIGLAIVGLDLITKWYFELYQFTFNNWFSFVFITNTGAAFSIFSGYNSWLIIASIIVLGLSFHFFKNYPLPLTLIISGGFGNLVDRIFLGYVRDFIAIGPWPVFNIADASNTIGVLLLVYHIYHEDKVYKRKTSN